MENSKVFKVYLAYRKDVNSRFDNKMNFVQAETPQAAKELATKLTSKLNPGLKEIIVKNCFELGTQIKEVPPKGRGILSKENFNNWVKSEKSGSTIANKPGTSISWLKSNPVAKLVTSTIEKSASTVTQLPWLKKKPVTKPVEKQGKPAPKKTGEPDWKLIDNLPHNREVDDYATFSREEKKLIENLK
jgi:hypothetical protein